MQWPWKYTPASLQLAKSASALRSVARDALIGRPSIQTTAVDYNVARSLYRNDNLDFYLGSGFVKPMIDLMVEYIGLPHVTSEDGDRDTFLNECIHDYWGAQLLQVWRESMRDSKTIVRFRQPRLDNPLFTEEDRMHGKIETIPPEMVDITYDPSDGDMIERAVVTHYIMVDERTQEEMLRGDSQRSREHEIKELITPKDYRFFDKTDDRWLETWQTTNSWGFVPMWTVWNEYDSSIGGGQSDIEPVMPFIKAFHDVLLQTLGAHKYHSTPKTKFNLKDVTTFLSNNFPEVLDPVTRQIIPGSKVKLTGNEVLFLNSEEDAGFIEATSVLGDSETLLNFLLDCIAIAGETPKWALLKTETANADNATIAPFEKKIGRKREQFKEIIIILAKMVMKARGQVPVTVRVTWPTIRLTDLAAKGQTVQQFVMAFDVAASHGWIADATIVEILSTLFPEISSAEIEMALAANNVVPEIPAPAPQSPTEGAEPAKSSNGNGGGSKKAARRAVATTKASRS